MKTRLILKPGQKGTKRLLRQYGDELVCVRYRYDEATRKRYKTVEIIVEEKVTNQRTMIDFAHCIRDLVDVHFPEAEKIVLVMDNLNTHKFAALYAAFVPSEARRIINKLEIHYTPKHGSWLNIAEIEFSVLQRRCLKARIPYQSTLIQKVAAWENARNTSEATVHWRFITDDARIKLHRLYPSLNVC